jgi:hypothetical protein
VTILDRANAALAAQPDIAFTVTAHGAAALEPSTDGPLDGDVVVKTDVVNRLLTLWGRRISARPITITGDPALWASVAATLFDDSPAWPSRIRSTVGITGTDEISVGIR